MNLPAKNIVLCNPRAGDVMDRLSLLNLAGRAGRLMQDHYGKIYCINMKDWKLGEDVFEDKAEFVQSSVDKTLHENMDLLIKYLEDPEQLVNKSVKSLATSLIMKYLKKLDSQDVVNFLERSKNVNPADIQTIVNRLEGIRDSLKLPRNVILKNRSFDPRFQNELYLALKETEFMALPFPSDQYIRWKMKSIFCLISGYLFRRKSRRWSYYGVLGANWILEKPYKEILDGKIKYSKQKEDETKKEFHNRVIEDLDVDIEKVLKYDYTRGLKCYSDITRFIVEENNEPKKHGCEELPIFLEWGTHHKNTLLLLELGLSRSVAIMINWFIENELNSSGECLAWLEANAGKIKGVMPDIFSKEVERLLENKLKNSQAPDGSDK